MRAVVTGGAGFIGSHVAAALAARGDEVHVLDNLSTGRREFVPDGVRLHVGDIREDADLDLVFDESRPEVCFHLAAQADVGTSVAEPVYDAEVNVLGTLAPARGRAPARDAGRVQLDRRRDLRRVRRSRPRRTRRDCPLSPYGTAKLAAEEYLATWNRLHGTRHVSLRFANVYGPHQAAGLEGGVVAIFLEHMAAGATSTIFGDGSQTRDFVYVGDVVRAVLAAAGHDGGVFNVGTGIETVGLGAVPAPAASSPASSARRSTRRARPGDLLRSVLDPGLAAAELGWRPETSLEDGLAETWGWIQRQLGGKEPRRGGRTPPHDGALPSLPRLRRALAYGDDRRRHPRPPRAGRARRRRGRTLRSVRRPQRPARRRAKGLRADQGRAARPSAQAGPADALARGRPRSSSSTETDAPAPRPPPRRASAGSATPSAAPPTRRTPATCARS